MSRGGRRLGGRLRAVALLLVLSACGGGADDAPAGAASTPGASVFAQLGALRPAAEAPPAQLSPAHAELLARLVSGEPWILHAADWRAAEPLDDDALRGLFGPERASELRGVRRWEVAAPVAPELPAGRVELRADARRLQPVERWLPDGLERRTAWQADERALVAWWSADGARLVLAAEAPPVKLELAYPAGLGPSPLWWSGAEREPRQVTLGQESRPVLAVATPGALALPVAPLDSEALDVGMAVADPGARVVDGAVRPRAEPPPPVRFAVDVRVDGERQRAWSQVVQAGAGFVDARVDLSPWRGRRVTIELVTERAGAGDLALAMWSTPRFRDAAHAAPARPHLVVLDLDTLRADGLGCYGNPRDTSPAIDAWAAAHAVRFDDHVSVGNWTLPSTVSMLTGLPIAAHGVVRFPLAMDADHRPLAARLREAGYETVGRTEAGVVVPEYGFDIGFDRFRARGLGHREFAEQGWDAELAWLRERHSAQPVFLFLQTYEAHGPFIDDRAFEDPAAPYRGPLAEQPVRPGHVDSVVQAAGGTLPEAERRYLRDVYDAGVRRLDRVVGRFLEALPEVFGDEPYVVVITSDHGEELGERERLGHGLSLHREQLRVPLLVRAPGQPGGRVVDEPASGLDLVPTLLDLAGLPPDPSLPGRALFRDELRAEYALVMQHDEQGFAVRLMDWKLVQDLSEEPRAIGAGLYALEDDPWERRSLAEQHPERREQLAAWLEQHRAEHAARDPAQPRAGEAEGERLRQLQELGYLEGQ